MSDYHPIPIRPGDDQFVGLAAKLGQQFAVRAAEHDCDNTFVAENYELLKSTGYTRLPIPIELGGLGATVRQVCFAQEELAMYCGSTALAVNMHLYLVLTSVYRWRHGAAEIEGLLRRIADGAILMTSGGSDGLWPSAIAQQVDGGYRVSGRKSFCSQAPIADILTTSVQYEDPDTGTVVLAIGVPMTTPGVSIVETWDTLGMRGTASHDVLLDDVFVSDAQVAARRPWGRWDPVMHNAMAHASPTMMSVYHGVAAGARNEAVRALRIRENGAGQLLAADPALHRLVGDIDTKLRTAWWSLLGLLDEMGDDFVPSEALSCAGLMAREHLLLNAVEVVNLAMQAVGGASFYKRSPLERAYRDVRAGEYHPLPPEKALFYIGRYALGQPTDEVW